MARSESALILFTLTPEAEGARKRLGFVRSSDARALFTSLIDHAVSLADGLTNTDLLIACEAGTSVSPRATQIRQRGRDFGESLRLAIEDAFALGYRRVVVIGNDAPEITTAYLSRAFSLLNRADGARAVLGPATDGGYNLLGLNAPCPIAFQAMPWGSDEVTRVTAERLQSSGFSLAELEPLGDIDDLDSLSRFFSRALVAGRGASAALWELVRRLPRPASGQFLPILPDSLTHTSPATNHRLRGPPLPTFQAR